MTKHNRVLVTGAGGFIGHHLVNYLTVRGSLVRGADIKKPQYQPTASDEVVLDLRTFANSLIATRRIAEVYGLAADMRGIGFIESIEELSVRNKTVINPYTIEASRMNGIGRYLYTSSACIYPGYRLKSPCNSFEGGRHLSCRC
jgi:nucleoside-diphosphate-sugar epimerase